MRRLQKIAVFCGSNLGEGDDFARAAEELGIYLAEQGKTLVFGGGKVGLMGVVSRAALRHEGQIEGVIPRFLKNAEMAYDRDIELLVVENMAARKEKMIELADAFIVLPGGIGTYEEVFEVLSRLQLRQIDKPIGFLNIDHFFDSFVALVEEMAKGGFIPPENRRLFCVGEKVEELFHALENYTMPEFNKKMRP